MNTTHSHTTTEPNSVKTRANNYNLTLTGTQSVQCNAIVRCGINLIVKHSTIPTIPYAYFLSPYIVICFYHSYKYIFIEANNVVHKHKPPNLSAGSSFSCKCIPVAVVIRVLRTRTDILNRNNETILPSPEIRSQQIYS